MIIDIVPDNQPPVFTSMPPKSLWQRFAPTPPGGLVTNYYDVAAYDPDPGDTITFSLKSAPAWVTMSGPARHPLRADLRLVRLPLSLGMDDGDRDGDGLARRLAPTRSSSST